MLESGDGIGVPGGSRGQQPRATRRRQPCCVAVHTSRMLGQSSSDLGRLVESVNADGGLDRIGVERRVDANLAVAHPVQPLRERLERRPGRGEVGLRQLHEPEHGLGEHGHQTSAPASASA